MTAQCTTDGSGPGNVCFMPFPIRRITHIIRHFLLARSKKSFSPNGHVCFVFTRFQVISAPPATSGHLTKGESPASKCLGKRCLFGHSLGVFDFTIFHPLSAQCTRHSGHVCAGRSVTVRCLWPAGLLQAAACDELLSAPLGASLSAPRPGDITGRMWQEDI